MKRLVGTQRRIGEGEGLTRMPRGSLPRWDTLVTIRVFGVVCSSACRPDLTALLVVGLLSVAEMSISHGKTSVLFSCLCNSSRLTCGFRLSEDAYHPTPRECRANYLVTSAGKCCRPPLAFGGTRRERRSGCGHVFWLASSPFQMKGPVKDDRESRLDGIISSRPRRPGRSQQQPS